MTRKEAIESTLASALDPHHLVVENESHRHSVRPGSETHFKVLVVSPAFDGKSRVERHRLVHDLLKPQFEQGLHALTIRPLTPEQWANDEANGFVSPRCMGGSKADE